MFEAELEEVSLLRDSIATIAELIDEAEMQITKDGLRMLAADRAVVTVVDFFLKSDAFKKYICDKDERIGINMEKFLQILKRANPNDRLMIKLDKDFLDLTLVNGSKRRFTLPLIDISREETPPIDKLEFPTSIKLKAEILNNAIEDAELISDSMVFHIKKDGISMSSKSDAHTAELILDPKEIEFSDIKEEPVRARYSLDYLKKIIKARKLAENVTISLATDYPMKLHFEVPDKLTLSFILAPRVEE